MKSYRNVSAKITLKMQLIHNPRLLSNIKETRILYFMQQQLGG